MLQPVLADPAAVKALLDVIPAEYAALNDLDIPGQRATGRRAVKPGSAPPSY